MNIQDDHELSLDLAFPLPYRVLFLIGIGILAWATNLHGLHILGIDPVTTLDLKTDGYPARLPLVAHRLTTFGSHAMTPVIYNSIYRVFVGYISFFFTSWTLYRLVTQNDPTIADKYGYIPAITSLLFILILFCPYNILFKDEREKFVNALRRSFFAPTSAPVLFSDVVFADIGTSFTKVFGDVWLSLCMVRPGNTMLTPPTQDGISRWILPVIMSLPFIARFRQCLIEYNHPLNESNRPFYNAIKYSTAFPVIFLSAAQGRSDTSDPVGQNGMHAWSGWHGESQLFRLWLLAVIVNSGYSFWWDLTNDWGLGIMKFADSDTRERQSPKHLILPRKHTRSSAVRQSGNLSDVSIESVSDRLAPYQPAEEAKRHRQRWKNDLRPTLLYPVAIYPILIALNFILRMSWFIKLSTPLSTARDGSSGIFWLEIAEVFRRWLWVFVRVEWEVVKRAQAEVVLSSSSGLDEDENPGFEILSRSVSPGL